MNPSRIALKVGIFVAVGLALLALLVLSFSRGSTLFDRTYHLRVLLPSAAGLKPTADVMMSGVPIGKATDLQLMPDGRSVAVNVIILAKYKIRTNALVAIDALGFLGDQYLAVTPSTNLEAGYFRDGAVVQGETPFNMQAAVRSVAGLLDQAKKTVTDLDFAINNINHTVLSQSSLSNLSHTLNHLESMSMRAQPDRRGRRRFDPLQYSGAGRSRDQPAPFLGETQSGRRRRGSLGGDQPAGSGRDDPEFA